ncbi:MAG: cytochrome protein [Devosia sp.]|uniref:c-type cytochrome n=1 Tax=Devosia sp. TaxID=1871048 RepID=UPI002638CE2D|nr:cytochrome c [Devosia sp.]MDB5529578.1 cytochrome protein [Devosia sp.]
MTTLSSRLRPGSRFILAAAGTLTAAGLALAFATPAAAQMTGGERIYFEKGQCNQCHGKAGNGVGDDPRENGANFRESGLDKETMVMIISCGVPGTNMPYFDKFSYTDDRCYGMTSEDAGTDKPQQPISTFLAKRDIDAVADYILETFVGKGPATPEELAPSAAPAAPPEPEH